MKSVSEGDAGRQASLPRPVALRMHSDDGYGCADPFRLWATKGSALGRFAAGRTAYVVRAEVWKHGWIGALERLEEIPGFCAAIRSGNAFSLVDDSREGPMSTTEMLEAFSMKARDWGAPVQEIVYTSGNRTLQGVDWLGSGNPGPTPTLAQTAE